MGDGARLTLVIDASTVLAILFEEKGGDVAIANCQGAFLSAVNLDEVLHKGGHKGISVEDIEEQLQRLQIAVVPFELEHARVAAKLHPRTYGTNTSFADRACMELALNRNCAVLTADRKWADLDLGVEIVLIR